MDELDDAVVAFVVVEVPPVGAGDEEAASAGVVNTIGGYFFIADNTGFDAPDAAPPEVAVDGLAGLVKPKMPLSTHC